MKGQKTRMLEHSYMTEILLRLRETEGLCITDLCNTGSGINGTRYRRVMELGSDPGSVITGRACI